VEYLLEIEKYGFRRGIATVRIWILGEIGQKEKCRGPLGAPLLTWSFGPPKATPRILNEKIIYWAVSPRSRIASRKTKASV